MTEPTSQVGSIEAQAGRSVLSEGIQLAGVTLAGYAIALAYEAGFANYFGVPLDLISVDASRVLLACAWLLGIGGLMLLMYLGINSLFEGPAHPVRAVLSTFALPAAGLLVFSWMYGSRSSVLLPMSLVLAFGLLFEFLVPFLTQRRIPKYLDKLSRHHAERVRMSAEAPFLLRSVRLLGQSGVMALLFAGYAVFMAYHLGQGQATTRKLFYCPVASPNVVFVRSYGSTAVGAWFNGPTRRLTGALVLGTLGDGMWADLSLTEVGPLERPMALEPTKQAKGEP